MKRLCLCSIICLFLCAHAFSQGQATIQCGPELKQVAAWTAPGSAYVVDYLSCGQSVSLGDPERGFFRVQLGQRFGYVDAKYVRTAESSAHQAPVVKLAKAIDPTIPDVSRLKPYHPATHRFGISFDFSHIGYEEPSAPMEEKGMMFGVSGDYSFRPGRLVLNLDGRFAVGSVEYSSPQGQDDIRDYVFEPRITAGYTFHASENVSIAPFSGIGYRYLFDGLRSANTSATLYYDRKSNYLYSPLGSEVSFAMKSGWSLMLSGEYDLFWRGWQFNENVRVGHIAYGSKYNTNNIQHNGWGTRASFKIIKNLGRIDFVADPYFRYWSIGDSDEYPLSIPGMYLYEPANTSKEWGARIGIRF